MKKWFKTALSGALVLSVFASQSLQGYEFSDSDINYYITYCSKPLKTQADADMCRAFKDWYRAKADEYQNQADELQGKIELIEGEIWQKGYEIEQLRLQVEQLGVQIQLLEESIAVAEEEIYQLGLQIAEKEAEVELRDGQIKQRMVDTQSFIGVNAYIDVIMGASDLVDLVRRVSVLQDITDYEQRQISELNELIAGLEHDRNESERIRQQAEDDKLMAEETQLALAEQQQMIMEAQQVLMVEEEALLAAQRDAEEASSAVLNKLPSINEEVFNEIQGNSYFTHPMGGSYTVSAGTWAYYGGGIHLGMDFAAPIGTPIVAPANGLILYADNPVGSTDGYLGNWVGWPRGGGNTISLVGTVNGTTYMFSFFHLAQAPWYVSAGQEVYAGQQIAGVGHSGNSTGPHLHFEVINMGDMSIQQVYNWFRGTADFSGGTGWSTTSTSCNAQGYAPCRERPEDLGF